MNARPRVYLRKLQAPDGARAATLVLAPGARFPLRDGPEVKGSRPSRFCGILARLAGFLGR